MGAQEEGEAAGGGCLPRMLLVPVMRDGEILAVFFFFFLMLKVFDFQGAFNKNNQTLLQHSFTTAVFRRR